MQVHLILGGSINIYKYGLASRYIKERWENRCRIHPVSLAVEGEKPVKMPKTVGLGTIEISTLFDTIKPDMVVTMADRYETLATAISASYMNIPLLHIQGGEITGSIDNKVRNAVTQLADIHCVATKRAGQKLSFMLNEYYRPVYIMHSKFVDTTEIEKLVNTPGRIIRSCKSDFQMIPPQLLKSVYVTGCPSIDLITENQDKWDRNHWQDYGGAGDIIDFTQPYIIVMYHADTTQYEKSYKQMNTILQAIKSLSKDIQKVFFWPNIDAGSDGIAKALREFHETTPLGCHFYRNISPEDFLKMLYFASCIVGNSSSGIREASFLGTPSVNIGDRQGGRERAKNVIDIPLLGMKDVEEIKKAILIQLEYGKYPQSTLYGKGTAGKKIAEVINIELTH